MYIISLRLKTNPLGHICNGYVHKNKSGKFYSDAEHAFVFTNLNDALLAIGDLTNTDHPKYEILSWEICDVMKGRVELSEDNVIGDIDALKSVIGSIFHRHLSSKIDMSKFEFDVTYENQSIIIKFPGHILTIGTSKFEIDSDKIHGTPLSKKVLITLTDELVQDLLVTVWNYMSGQPVNLLKFEED